MKKLFYMILAALIGLTIVSACGGKDAKDGEGQEGSAKKVAETINKRISSCTNSANISGSFAVKVGTANFTIYESDNDSVDFQLEIPVVAENRQPVKKISKIALSMWYVLPTCSNDNLFSNLQLSQSQFLKVLEMDKKAVETSRTTDPVRFRFYGRMAKSELENLRNAESVFTSANIDNE